MFRRRKGTTKITIETHEITTVRLRHDAAGLRYCPICRQEVAGVSPEESAQLFQTDEVKLAELFALNRIHGVGEAAICGNSLVEYFH